MRILLLICITLLLGACATTPTETVLPEVVVKPQVRIVGYWEDTTAPHPERKPWTDEWTSIIRKDLNLYAKAKDITDVCPKFKTLNDDLKVKGILEFWIAMAYFESSFNPKSNSVDVGNEQNKCSWSIGLYQLSCTDNAAKAMGAKTFESLQDPLKNIQVAGEQMRRQLNKCGEIFLPNSSTCRYWAVALKGNKYSKIPEIKARVLKYAPECK